MQIEQTALPGVVILTPRRFGDDRGWFCETWNAARMAEAGWDIPFVQDNHSMSGPVGTLRGLHYQRPPHAQAKLVRCTRGAIFDVALDVRPGSPTFGRSVGAELSAENGAMLYVPKGFAHGFQTLTDDAEVFYQMSEFYTPELGRGVRWNDPAFAIAWPLPVTVMAPRDRDYPDVDLAQLAPLAVFLERK